MIDPQNTMVTGIDGMKAEAEQKSDVNKYHQTNSMGPTGLLDP